MLRQRDKELINLKLEIQKLRSTSENEIKKIRKAQQNGVQSSLTNLPTNGSGDGGSGNGMTLNKTYSFDPYSGNKGKAVNLNQSAMFDSNISSARESNFKNGEKKNLDLNNTFQIEVSDNPFTGIGSLPSARARDAPKLNEELFGINGQGRSRLNS